MKTLLNNHTNKIYWRVSVQHYDFTESVICKVSYGYHSAPPKDTVIKNRNNDWNGWTELKYFEDKHGALKYVWEADGAAS